MDLRKLGRTGEMISAIGLGGWHIGPVPIPEETDAIRLMHAAIDRGITFFDNSWDYHDGVSEERMGKALAEGGRHKVFLMSKVCNRDFDGAVQCLEDSLRRLQTDYLDLWQFHEINFDNDPEWIFTRGGIEAAIRAREQGKVRFIGFTGHKHPHIHLDMLSRPFDWDTCQMPVNVMDAQYRSFAGQVIPECRAKGVGVIGMKGLGGGFTSGMILEKTNLRAAECYRFALGQDVDVQVMGCTSFEERYPRRDDFLSEPGSGQRPEWGCKRRRGDGDAYRRSHDQRRGHVLDANVRLASPFVPLVPEERANLLQRSREVATDGRCEQFKSTSNFEGPFHLRQHGFA